MPSISTLVALAALTTTAVGQSTATATLLLPDWCVTQSQPAVTILGANSLTTYSYSCSTDTAAMSSASAKASKLGESARQKASEVQASLGVTEAKNPRPTDDSRDNIARYARGLVHERDSSYECYGFDAFDACIPWEITQGESFWAVHYTATDVGGVDQECTFGEGGVQNGPATCTASGRLDPNIWGDGDGSHTETFAKTEVDDFYIRNTVVATFGSQAAGTSGGVSGSITPAITGTATATGTAAAVNVESPGLAAPRSVPTGAMLMVAGAGGILAAAIAL
ncbi:hypothetical protein BU24DRAFT_463581 [Aaosphaeria arxii CBS 175.79]|uniref:Uncharacterized protein n=1 Tax=Aaosphaeria arxii CBS 175.79 TaxID=1450172 RepID=A0A6A5XPS2_9PLEO|nr:uncharacterized protein BU24DRAFT_463581 [Aaosphaeria arxii CBS 175.79]KAF2014837.1 hypothetical protein BU24DRAFT_463581 [Aaosphaeria arxii CBS 175.79]